MDEIEVDGPPIIWQNGGRQEMGIAAFVLDEKALNESSAGSMADNATKEAEDGRRLAKDSQEEDLGDFREDEETMARMVAKAETEAAKHEEEMKQKAKMSLKTRTSLRMRCVVIRITLAVCTPCSVYLILGRNLLSNTLTHACTHRTVSSPITRPGPLGVI